MAEEAFGPVFEIHGGGLDLVFPHHENELAQSRALGHDFAHIWTHNGMLAFGGEKMSKSLGNDVSLRSVLDTWGREVVLLFFLSAHWRKPIDFTDDDARRRRKAQVETFRNFFLAERDGDEDGEQILEQELAAAARRRLQHARRARALPRLAGPRGVDVAALGARSLRARVDRGAAHRRRRSWSRSPSGAATRAGRRTSSRPTVCATSSTRRAGRYATSPTRRATSSRRKP